MKKEESLQGIGGWLIVVLIIFIFSAISKFFDIVGFILRPLIIKSLGNLPLFGEVIEKIELSMSVQIITVILSAASLVLLIFTIHSLIKKKEKAKKLSIITLWVLFAISLFGSIVSIILIPSTIEALKEIGVYTGDVLEQTILSSYISKIAGIVFNLAWTIIWTLYFIKSKRVRNTLIEK